MKSTSPPMRTSVLVASGSPGSMTPTLGLISRAASAGSTGRRTTATVS
jgi:hypothetical protein